MERHDASDLVEALWTLFNWISWVVRVVAKFGYRIPVCSDVAAHDRVCSSDRVATVWAFSLVAFTCFRIKKGLEGTASDWHCSCNSVSSRWTRILSISALILLNIPDFAILATLQWVSVGNWVASWWAFNRVFRLALSGLDIENSVVGAAEICSRNKVFAVGAGILSISTLIKLNVPDLAVLAALKWISVGNWVASWWAFNGVFRFAFSRFEIQESFVRAANVGSRDKVLTLWARILSISALIVFDIPDFAVFATLQWVSVGNWVASWGAFNRVFRLALSGFDIENSVVGAAEICSRNQVFAVGARILSISTLIKRNVPDLAVLAALLWVSVRDRITSGWAFNWVFRLTLSGLEIENSVVGAADVRTRNEVLSLGARILALSRLRIKDGFPWTAFEWIDRNLESSFGTDTLGRRCSWHENRSFWTAVKKCCKGLSIVPAFFALACTCFRI